MKFKLKIESGDDAMVGFPYEAVAEILRDVANKLDCGGESGPIHDANGNKVGRFTLDVEEV